MDLGPAPPQGTYALIFITVLTTAVVTLLVTKIGATLLSALAWPFVFVGEALYKRIAPRNPFSIALRSYKKHVARSKLALIENPVGAAVRVPLEQAYAPLKLMSKPNQEGIELFPYVASNPRIIVLSGPGTGKSPVHRKSKLESSLLTSLRRLVTLNLGNGQVCSHLERI
jgi:hypothetical protein